MTLNLDKGTWKRVVLGDVASASKEKCDPSDGSIKRYVAGEHMDTDDLKIHRWGTVGDGYLGPAFHRRFRPGQILYGSRRTYLRKVAVADFDGVCANTTFVLESKDPSVLFGEFLPFIMTAEPFHAFAIAESKGSVNPYVNWSDIARYEFDLPPFDEQRRIAHLFLAIEREGQALLILRGRGEIAHRAWLDNQLDSLMAEGATPFEQSWTRSPQSGWSAAPVDGLTGWFVLSLAALGPQGYRPGQLKNVPDASEVRNAVLAPGDLLISRANTVETVGRVGIFSEDRADVSFPDTMMRLHLQDTILPEFAEAVLSSSHGRRHMRRTAAGSATSMVKINRASLGKFMFPDAAIDTQRILLEQLEVFKQALRSFDSQAARLRATRNTISTDIFG